MLVVKVMALLPARSALTVILSEVSNAIEFADVADIDEDDVGIVLHLQRVFNAGRYDLGVGLGQELFHRLLELERHRFSPSRMILRPRCFWASRGQE